MHKSHLALHPSSYYFEQFKEDLIEILPSQEGGPHTLINGEFVKTATHGSNSIWLSERPEQGYIKIKAGEYDFDLFFMDLIDFQVTSVSIEIARSILHSIVEMDALARSFSVDENYEEDLTYINISKDVVEFHYVAGYVNTSWGVYFARDELGTWTIKELG